VEIVAFVSSVGAVSLPHSMDLLNTVTRTEVDKTFVRCPDVRKSEEMEKIILEAKADNDSIGGIVTCVCRNVPAALGEPCFDKLEAMLAHAMLSIPATKGFEIGSGFDGTKLRGLH
jgi:chorismate synthase